MKLSGPLDLKACIHYLIRRKMEDIKKNYKSVTEIEEELRNVRLENFLDFDSIRRYEFTRCEGCDGLLLGHLEVKCSGKDGVRYGS